MYANMFTIPFYDFSRKASFVGSFDEDSSDNIRYLFPTGCKFVDILIDNSSRLRSIGSSDDNNNNIVARLPVTTKAPTQEPYVYSTPLPGYIPPGPLNIYAPHQLQPPTNKFPTSFVPPAVYLPPANATKPTTPANTYLPPANTYLPPADPTTTPPTKPDNTYLPPPTKPQNTYVPPPTEPDNTYLPPITNPVNVYLPPSQPDNTYLPPQNPTNTYLPPDGVPPPITTDILPPEPPTCSSISNCCEEAAPGRFIIPIPIKNDHKSSGCCQQYAKLILPIAGFDEASLMKLKSVVNQEIDASVVVRNILEKLI